MSHIPNTPPRRTAPQPEEPTAPLERDAPIDWDTSFAAMHQERKTALWLGVGLAVPLLGLVVWLYLTLPEKGFALALLIFGGAGCYGPVHIALSRISRRVGDVVSTQLGYDYDPGAVLFPLRDFDPMMGHYNRSSVEDELSARRGNIDLRFADVTLKHVTGSGKRRRTRVVFRGICISLHMPNPIEVTALIASDKGFFNRLDGWGNGLDRVKLEDPLFEKAFEVYGSDQIATRRLLTPTMMERLLALKTRHTGLQAYVARGRFHVALPTRHQLFEVGLFTPLDQSLLADFVSDIRDIEQLVDALQLDRASRI